MLFVSGCPPGYAIGFAPTDREGDPGPRGDRREARAGKLTN